jgi:hypothetical protein
VLRRAAEAASAILSSTATEAAVQRRQRADTRKHCSARCATCVRIVSNLQVLIECVLVALETWQSKEAERSAFHLKRSSGKSETSLTRAPLRGTSPPSE